MGDWKPREPVRLHGGPGLQLNWTQETGRLEGEGGRERRVRQEGRIRACASEEENFNWRQFVESPGGWNPPGSSRLLSFTRMTTLYTVTPLVFKPSTFVHLRRHFYFHRFFLLFLPPPIIHSILFFLAIQEILYFKYHVKNEEMLYRMF